MFRVVTALAMTLALVAGACGDSDDSDRNALHGGSEKSWVLVRATQGGTDITDQLPAEDQDDEYVVVSDGTFRVLEVVGDEGSLKDEGTWQLSDDGATYNETSGRAGELEWTVLEITESSLRMSVDFSGNVLEFTYEPAR